jgi:hypothetical protein
VLLEVLDASTTPKSLTKHRGVIIQLAQVYKQISAPFGDLAQTVLRGISTPALESTNAATYASLEDLISGLNDVRDTIALQMRKMLYDAAFNGQEIDVHEAQALIEQGNSLIESAHKLADEPD